jgi:hypothetical protein
MTSSQFGEEEMVSPGSDETSGGATPKSAAADLGVAELLARVEAATGPDRALDSAIAIALRVGAEGYPRSPLGTFRPGYVQADLGRDGWSVGWRTEPYTASLDAALALVARALPGGWHVNLGRTYRDKSGRGPWMAYLENDPDEAQAHAPTASLALLAAMLRALGNSPTPSLAKRAAPGEKS